ncbi:MAG TPA: ABC transporter permease [Candidatus Limnocylindrales bacterium]
MRHVIAIALKDLRLTIRDRTALLGMLGAPLALALVLGFAFGSFGGSSGAIPVVVVNADGSAGGGAAIVAVLRSPDLASLLKVTTAPDVASARQAVDDGTVSAAILIPAGLGSAITAGRPASQAVVEVYGNPSQGTLSGIVQTVVDGVLARLVAASTTATVTAESLVRAGILGSADPRLATAAAAAATEAASATSVVIAGSGPTNSGTTDYGRIVGPSMAVLFLMFTVTAGGRRMLEERDNGTLARLLASPVRRSEVLVGKGAGIFLIGLIQMATLLALTTVIFSIAWSSLAGLVLLTGAVVFCATCWGVLIAGLARTAAQANQAGTAITIVFGMIAGNFVPRADLPALLQNISLATPNGLGLEGYQSLAGTGDFASLAPIVAGLVLAGAVVLALAIIGSRGRLTSV